MPFCGERRESFVSTRELAAWTECHAVWVGLFVLAGVGSVYVTGKQSYRARDGLSLLQENGRIAIRMIEQTVQRAGYPMFADIEPVIHAQDQIEGLVQRDGAAADKLRLKPSSDGADGASDSLAVAYQPVKGSAWERGEDCVGNETRLDGLVISRFFVDKGVLKCHGSGKSSAEPMVDEVEAMQVEYGVDVSDDGFADRYVPLGDVSDWDKVVSVRVALLVGSGVDVLDKGITGKQKFMLAGQEVEIDSRNDRQLYRVFTTTIPLRNRMPIF